MHFILSLLVALHVRCCNLTGMAFAGSVRTSARSTPGVLRSAVYNPLSLTRVGRLEHIIRELDVDLLFLVGTGIRQRGSESYSKWKTDVDGNIFQVVSWGWKPAEGSNKSAGVMIVYGGALQGARITQDDVFSPDPLIQGRAGALRLKTRNPERDLLPTIGYPPPPIGVQRGKQVHAANATAKWIHETVNSSPSRTFPMIGIDINLRTGLTAEGRWPGHGPFFLNENKSTTAMQWLAFYEQGNFANPSTFYKAAGPTFFAPNGGASTLDQIIIPTSALQNITSLSVAWLAGRRLQLIPHQQRRDHYPLVLTFRYSFKQVISKKEQIDRWDQDKISSCLSKGSNRIDFLQDLEKAIVDITPNLRSSPRLRMSTTTGSFLQILSEKLPSHTFA
jgi:hypothetical protein